MNTVERMTDLMDLELAKKMLLGLSAAALILIPADGLWIRFERFKPISTDLIKQQRTLEKTEAEAAYLTIFEGNTLFGTVASNTAAPALRASLAELVKDYRLKGVVILSEPEAIVEDARTQKTSFVKAGQQLGDLTVKEIKEGLMILSYLGEEIKLEIQ